MFTFCVFFVYFEVRYGNNGKVGEWPGNKNFSNILSKTDADHFVPMELYV